MLQHWRSFLEHAGSPAQLVSPQLCYIETVLTRALVGSRDLGPMTLNMLFFVVLVTDVSSTLVTCHVGDCVGFALVSCV